jgi:prepilin-type processing-associated H-X9-DG protein
MNNQRMFGCASDPDYGTPPWTYRPFVGSYAYNECINTFWPTTCAGSLTKIAQSRHPAATPMIQEHNGNHTFTPDCFRGVDPYSVWAFSMRHRGGGNILWLDAHVEKLKYADYMSQANAIDPGKFCRDSY